MSAFTSARRRCCNPNPAAIVRLTTIAIYVEIINAGAVWASRLIVVFGIGLCMLAVFPQEPMDQPLTWHGAIHRYVALAAFTALPLAGLLLGQARRTSYAALAALVAFVGTFVFDARAVSGLAERILLVLELALLVAFVRQAAPALTEVKVGA